MQLGQLRGQYNISALGSVATFNLFVPPPVGKGVSDTTAARYSCLLEMSEAAFFMMAEELMNEERKECWRALPEATRGNFKALIVKGCDDHIAALMLKHFDQALVQLAQVDGSAVPWLAHYTKIGPMTRISICAVSRVICPGIQRRYPGH